MKWRIAILALLVHANVAAAQSKLRQVLPYEYDLLDAIFDVYGHYSTVYTVQAYERQPLFVLESIENKWGISEMMCEEVVSYHLLSHRYTEDRDYGRIFTTNQAGLINIGFCGIDNQKLNRFVDFIEVNGKRYVSELSVGFDAEEAKEYGISFMKTQESGSQPIIYFPLIGGGHGGGFAYTATTIVPNKKKRLIIQLLISDICAFGKEVRICNYHEKRLVEFTKNVVNRYVRY